MATSCLEPVYSVTALVPSDTACLVLRQFHPHIGISSKASPYTSSKQGLSTSLMALTLNFTTHCFAKVTYSEGSKAQIKNVGYK